MSTATNFLEQNACGKMSAELRNAIRVSVLYPPQHEDKADRFVVVNPKLREPRELYSAASLEHPPKWPIECQVIPEKIVHLSSPSLSSEPFYVTTNSEPQPRPVGEEMSTVIYDYQPKLCVDYVKLLTKYCRSSFSGSEELTTYDTDETTLKFESRFEAGNLAKVLKVTNVYYELYLRPDMYTTRHAQWYYFRIQNTRENIVYRFSIVNLSKSDSLYRSGMKPLLYSEKNAVTNGVGWMRCGHNISYYKNDITDNNSQSYTLTFNLKFQYSNDTVFIAQSYPYTYSNLQAYLQEIQANPNKARFCQQRLLCKSLAGNNVYILTITAPPESDDEQEQVKKPAIVLTARVHPGESPSSFMMKGVIDFLTSDSPHAEELRSRFIFKLIPMLNPDGVIVGNSRCCLLGQDLNRQYSTVLREAFPQIYQKKVLLRRLADENGIFLYCDIHGHSRKNNVFMYGCENRRIAEKKLTEQVFPLMMHKNAADKFSFSSCKFRIQKSKEGTGRIFVWTLGVTNSYTLEISLCGSTLGSRENTHFNFVDYVDLGRHFCETLLDYSDTTTAKERIRMKILNKLKIFGSTAEEPKNIPISDYSSLSHSDADIESDTTEDDDDTDAANSKIPVARQVSLRTSNSKGAGGKVKVLDSAMTTTKNKILSKNRSSVKRVRSDNDRNLLTAQLKPSQGTLQLPIVSPIISGRLRSPTIKLETGSYEDTGDTGTQTEDECDFSDAAMKNDIYFSNLPGLTTEMSTNVLTSSFESLNLLQKPIRSNAKRIYGPRQASKQLLIETNDLKVNCAKLPVLFNSSPSSEYCRRGNQSILNKSKKSYKTVDRNGHNIILCKNRESERSLVSSQAIPRNPESIFVKRLPQPSRSLSHSDDFKSVAPRRHSLNPTSYLLEKSKLFLPGRLKKSNSTTTTEKKRKEDTYTANRKERMADTTNKGEITNTESVVIPPDKILEAATTLIHSKTTKKLMKLKRSLKQTTTQQQRKTNSPAIGNKITEGNSVIPETSQGVSDQSSDATRGNFVTDLLTYASNASHKAKNSPDLMTDMEKVYLWSNPVAASTNFRLVEGTLNQPRSSVSVKNTTRRKVKKGISKTGKKLSLNRSSITTVPTAVSKLTSLTAKVLTSLDLDGNVIKSESSHSGNIRPDTVETGTISELAIVPRETAAPTGSIGKLIRKKVRKSSKVKKVIRKKKIDIEQPEPAVSEPNGSKAKSHKVEYLQRISNLQDSLEQSVTALLSEIESKKKNRVGTEVKSIDKTFGWESKNLVAFRRLLENQKRIIQLQIDLCQGLPVNECNFQDSNADSTRPGNSDDRFDLFAPYACERDGRMVFYCSLCDVSSESEMLFRLHLESPQHFRHAYDDIEKEVPVMPTKLSRNNPRSTVSMKLISKPLKPEETERNIKSMPSVVNYNSDGKEVVKTYILESDTLV